MDTLKLQAYLDGELSASEAQEVAVALTRDEQARSLFNELKATKMVIAANEPEVCVPESREFYFSTIAREIELLERAEAAVAPLLPWWRRLAVPLGITAVVVALAIPAGLKLMNRTVAAQQPDIDSASTSTFAFYNDDENPNVTVVWVNPNGTANGN